MEHTLIQILVLYDHINILVLYDQHSRSLRSTFSFSTINILVLYDHINILVLDDHIMDLSKFSFYFYDHMKISAVYISSAKTTNNHYCSCNLAHSNKKIISSCQRLRFLLFCSHLIFMFSYKTSTVCICQTAKY